jgi:hypothetical protein
VSSRLNEEERKLSEELQGIIKNIGDIGKEVFIIFYLPN